ncbi:MAG: L-lactate dehydrogenase [Pseudomonadota bacterium]|jgi:isopentenyl diphosphate isomerase/L-lactate dehydrogenase-like FMN-dependent dehydrogenase
MNERRALLKFLAASPLLGSFAAAERALADDYSVESAADALDVFEFEAVARKVLPPAHWGFLSSGVDGDVTLRANSEAYARWQLKSRRLVDVSRLDLSTAVLGTRMSSPLFLSPIGSQRAFHALGEMEVAKAARSRNALQVVSTVASMPLETVIEARGAPVWLQLYTTSSPAVMAKLVRRAEKAGCPVVAVTVDTPAGRNTATATRLRREDTRTCANCHVVGPGGDPLPNLALKPMFAGIETQGLGYTSPSLTWDFVKRLRDLTTMKIVLKGIEDEVDARLAVEHGADGVYVSNHGGRAFESGRGTVESLAEVVRGVDGKIPVLLDGGIRRGTDVYKALALGASAVGIGRPQVWGLASFGQQGVERVLDILNMELRYAMAGCGVRAPREITAASLYDTRRG